MTTLERSRSRRSLLPDWFILLSLVMIVASDYKFRRRTLGDSLGGSLDIMVMVEIAVYVLVAVLMATQHLRIARPLRASPIMVAMWIYVGIMAASSLYAPYPTLAMVRAAQALVVAVFCHMLADRATLAQFRHFSHWFVGLMVVSIGVGLAYVAPTSRYQAGRFTWLHVHTVTAASLLAVGLLLVVGCLTVQPPRRRPSWATFSLVSSALLITVFLVMTKTRGSVGGAVVGLAVYALLRVPYRRRGAVAVLMALGLGGLLYFVLPVLTAYIERGESAEGVTTLSNRTELWSLAWQDFLEKPVFGWGLTASRGLFFDAVQLGGAHNAFVNAFVDGGLVGLVAWLGLLGAMVVTMFTTWRRHSAARPYIALCAGVLTCMVVNGITMEGIGAAAGQAFLLLCMLGAWIVTIQRSAEEAVSELTQELPPSGEESRSGPSGTPPRRPAPAGR